VKFVASPATPVAGWRRRIDSAYGTRIPSGCGRVAARTVRRKPKMNGPSRQRRPSAQRQCERDLNGVEIGNGRTRNTDPDLCRGARAGWLGRHLRRRGLDFTISSLTSNSRPVGVLLARAVR
jgi:hypothetical protein